MRKTLLFFCVAGALLSVADMASSHAAEVDVLINKLVEKGILSQKEAGELLNDLQKEGTRQQTSVKETAEQAAKETAQKTVKEEAKSWAKLPDWVNRIHFKGDFRLRAPMSSSSSTINIFPIVMAHPSIPCSLVFCRRRQGNS